MTQDLRSPGGRLALATGCEEKQVDPDLIGGLSDTRRGGQAGKGANETEARDPVLSVRPPVCTAGSGFA